VYGEGIDERRRRDPIARATRVLDSKIGHPPGLTACPKQTSVFLAAIIRPQHISGKNAFASN
jgi:hypothetical protein